MPTPTKPAKDPQFTVWWFERRSKVDDTLVRKYRDYHHRRQAMRYCDRVKSEALKGEIKGWGEIRHQTWHPGYITANR
jgi:hypothetical protein